MIHSFIHCWMKRLFTDLSYTAVFSPILLSRTWTTLLLCAFMRCTRLMVSQESEHLKHI